MCALVRNDMLKAGALLLDKTVFRQHTASVLALCGQAASYCMSLRGAKRRDNPLSCGRTKRKAILWANTESVTDFPWESVVAHADSYMFLHVIARSGATWQSASPAVAQSRKQHLRRIRESVTNLPKQQRTCQASLRGKRIATPVCALVRNDMQKEGRVRGCKDGVRNDMLKAGRRARVRGRGSQ